MELQSATQKPSVCPAAVLPNDDRGWLGREPTIDEREIVSYIKSRPLPSAMLHVGVGTALLSREFGERVVQGLTKDGAEAVSARDLGLDVIVCNKYDVPSYDRLLRGNFNCIVDVNIRSYACCDEHFRAFMSRMLGALAPAGRLVTSMRGLEYLVPTTIAALSGLCPEWSLRTRGNVVVMQRRRQATWRRWLQSLRG